MVMDQPQLPSFSYDEGFSGSWILSLMSKIKGGRWVYMSPLGVRSAAFESHLRRAVHTINHYESECEDRNLLKGSSGPGLHFCVCRYCSLSLLNQTRIRSVVQRPRWPFAQSMLRCCHPSSAVRGDLRTYNPGLMLLCPNLPSLGRLCHQGHRDKRMHEKSLHPSMTSVTDDDLSLYLVVFPPFPQQVVSECFISPALVVASLDVPCRTMDVVVPGFWKDLPI